MKFIKGMDISMVKELEQYGASYRLNGKKEDLFAILKTCGANNVRIRIWPDPYDENGNSYGGGGNDLETTIEIAERTVQSGMDFMLDFHYSDFWADPAKQVKPKAWKELSGEALETAVYLHTVDTLKALKNHKLVPTMVQVGNEITKGLLWPDGYIEQTENMAHLLQAGLKGCERSVRTQGSYCIWISERIIKCIDSGLIRFHRMRWILILLECRIIRTGTEVFHFFWII